MFDLPKSILKKVLTTFHTNRDALTPDEQQLALRICFCTLCEYYWVRRFKPDPERCPQCHKRGWNMPLVNAMKASTDTILSSEVIPQKQIAEANHDKG